MCTIALTKSRNLNCVKTRVGIRSLSIVIYDPLNRVVGYAPSLGKAEIASLDVSAAATAAGNVIVTLDGVATNVAVLLADTATVVATKIRAAVFTGWTTGGTGITVTFTANTIGVKTDAVYSAGTAGATGTMTTTVQGENVRSGGVETLPAYMLTATAPVGAKIARFDVKNTTTNYTDTLTNNMDTRSGGRKGELQLVLVSATGLDNVILADIVNQLTNSEFVGFLEMKNGDVFSIGSQFGAMVTTAVDTTGAQSGDLDGVTLTISTDEADSFRKYWLTAPALAQLLASTLAY